jgi:hypothetical protein
MTALAIISLSGLLNWTIVGPATTSVMRERKRQETRDGKPYYQEGEKSAEMKKLNTRFGVLHGVSTVVNMVGFGASVWYGFLIAERMV